MEEDHHAKVSSIQHLKGHIAPMRTLQEISPSVEFGDAYTVEIIQKCASQVSKILDKTFPRDPSRPFNHLRRFVKEGFLPEQLQDAIEKERRHRESADAATATALPDVPTIFVLIPPPLPELAHLRTLLAPVVPPHHRRPLEPAHDGSQLDRSEDSTQLIPNLAGPVSESKSETASFPIHRITIPLLPPLNQKQADQWTSTCWPTNFNAAFPRGIIAPPVKILRATMTNIAPKAGYYLGLAHKVAQEAKRLGRGRGIGVVVVDPALASIDNNSHDDAEEEGDNGVVAVAGDARYCAPGIVSRDADGQQQQDSPDCEGGPELHPIMRVVEMVASSRRAAKSAATSTTTTSAESTNSHTPPLTPLESYYLYRPHSSPYTLPAEATEPAEGMAEAEAQKETNNTRILPRSAGGYLCTDLDIYITHEPCLSCSMGMLLSRFRAITFPRRGRLGSGGLASSASYTTSTIEHEEGEEGLEPGQEREQEEVSEEKSEPEARGVYYGLHWRKELNWRAMCFEFVEVDDMHIDGVEDRGDYYA